MEIQSNVSLNKYNTYRVGGEAEYFTKINQIEDLILVKDWAFKNKKSLNFIGKGSNLLISDRQIKGVTLLNNIKRFDIYNNTISIGSGECISQVALKLAKLGYLGFEWGIGIPGTIGGAIIMNASAHNKSISNILISTKVLTSFNIEETILNKELNFGYRNSNLQNTKNFIIEGTFKLKKETYKGEAWELTQEHLKHRINSQPYNTFNCGSVFRNPLNLSAAQLIDTLKLKGFHYKGAEVSNKHANFIINKNNASSNSVYTLIKYIQQVVQDRYHIELEPEVKLLGEFNIE